MNWQQEFPQTEGDWLWVNMWGCACCIHKSGIAYVSDYTGADDLPPIVYTDNKGKLLGISWEGQKPHFNDAEEKCPQITAWAKIKLPPKKWAEREQ